MTKLRVGSLFSGIGGLDLGLEMTGGFQTVWFSEIEPYPCEVLKHHWPGVPNHGDITKIDWTQVEPIDLLCGGFPCQDVSVAGKRAGVKDGTRSGLWSEFARAIGILRPRYVLIENVPGLLSVDAGAGFNRVLSDLAQMGYDAEWACVSAADVGAPHRRERLFIVAHTELHGHPAAPDGRSLPESNDLGRAQEPQAERGAEGRGGEQQGSGPLGNPDSERINGGGRLTPEAGRREPASAGCELADPDGRGLHPGESRTDQRTVPAADGRSDRQYQRIFQPIPRSGFWDSWQLSRPVCGEPDGVRAGVDGAAGVSPWGTPRATDYKGAGPAGSSSANHLDDRGYLTGQVANMEPQMWRTPQGQEPGIDIERLETKNGSPASPGQRNYDKATGRMAQIGLTQEVAMRNQPARLIPPGIPLLETGRKRRVAKLKALGNAVVPQCAEYVGRCILAHYARTRPDGYTEACQVN